MASNKLQVASAKWKVTRAGTSGKSDNKLKVARAGTSGKLQVSSGKSSMLQAPTFHLILSTCYRDSITWYSPLSTWTLSV